MVLLRLNDDQAGIVLSGLENLSESAKEAQRMFRKALDSHDYSSITKENITTEIEAETEIITTLQPIIDYLTEKLNAT